MTARILFLLTIFLLALNFPCNAQLDTTRLPARRGMILSVYTFSSDTLDFSGDTLVVRMEDYDSKVSYAVPSHPNPAHYKADLIFYYDSDTAYVIYQSARMAYTDNRQKPMKMSSPRTVPGTWKISAETRKVELVVPEWNWDYTWIVERYVDYYLFVRVNK
jgi:hypothetical protein